LAAKLDELKRKKLTLKKETFVKAKPTPIK
jgi:hypothetical protein